MRHSIILGCALAFFGTGTAHASVLPQSPEPPVSAAAAITKANATEEAERETSALSRAQDYAVENYWRNMSRLAAEAERERAEAAAEEARHKRLVRRNAASAKKERAAAAADEMSPGQRAKNEAEALAKAQDRVVAYYKRSLGIETIVERAGRGVEKLSCFSGVRDRQARMGVHLVNGKIDYFAFYSKWKPRTCSIYVERDSASRWEDYGTVSKVTFVDGKGVLLIERRDGGYRFIFKDVDRMRYCGIDGKINGSLAVRRGQKSCVVKGIMDGHQG